MSGIRGPDYNFEDFCKEFFPVPIDQLKDKDEDKKEELDGLKTEDEKEKIDELKVKNEDEKVVEPVEPVAPVETVEQAK